MKSIFLTLRRLALATLGGVILAVPAFAAQIDCPLSQVRREITTQLPSGWWNTPMVSRLSDTRVIQIAGRPALQCIYGAAGSIQRNSPNGQTCSANARGFTCVSAAPRTYSTGSLHIPQTWAADLDRGVVGQGGEDIWFQAETASLLYLKPRNGAKIGVGDRSNRGFEGCRNARMSNARVSLRDIPVGSYVCMRSSEGRISQFRVNAVTGGSPKTLSIGYITWR